MTGIHLQYICKTIANSFVFLRKPALYVDKAASRPEYLEAHKLTGNKGKAPVFKGL